MSAEARRATEVAAGPGDVWALLADFGAISAWAADVDHSCLLHDGDLAPGLVRRVQVGRTTLLEVVDALETGRRLGYRIEGLPPVLRAVRNEWTLRPADGGTEVTLTTTVDAGPRPPQQLLARLVARRMGRTSDHLLAGLAAALPTGDPTRA